MARVTELHPGDAFAGFRVVRKLSEGGMGAIYVVTQEATGRQRALKLMHPELIANTDLRDKFMQEARIGARIDSEHIVDVVDAGVEPEAGLPWLAMEMLEGEDLAALLSRRGRLELSEVHAIFEQLCHAVSAAHAAGIVHRDLKPDNIFLAATKQAGGSFVIKVLDFGIAKLLLESRTGATGAIGTPLWMAPEQTDSRAVISAATDVWALGLIAYRLLTGRNFWRGAEGEHASLHVFLREVVIDTIPPASVRAAEQGVAATLPAEFDDWFARCVARDAKDRFQTAGPAADAFRTLGTTAGEPWVGPEPSALPSALPNAGVVVRTGEPARDREGSTALGSAHTMQDVSSLADVTASANANAEPSPSPAIPGLPPRAASLWLPGGVVAIAIVGAVAFRLRSGHEVKTPAHPIAAPVADNLCPKSMVPIPTGTFTMGWNDGTADERPSSPLSVAAFCLDSTEVLVSEYDACVAAKKCLPPSPLAIGPQITPETSQQWSAECNANHPERQDHPVNCVSWDDASTFCKWGGKRLPTETEWEFAARGKEGRLYPWGDTGPTKDHVNGCGEECAHGRLMGEHALVSLYNGSDGWASTAPARSYGRGKTPEGAYDLAGNVLEWTESAYCPYSDLACKSQWKVARGGAWTSDVHEGVRATHRTKEPRDVKLPDLGFRCAL